MNNEEGSNSVAGCLSRQHFSYLHSAVLRGRLRKTASEIEVWMRVNDEIIVSESEVIDGMESNSIPSIKIRHNVSSRWLWLGDG